MRKAFGILLLTACSGKETAGDDDATDVTPPTQAPGGDCVADGAAGTTWGEQGPFIPVTAIVTYEFGELDGRVTRIYVPEHPRAVAIPFEGRKVYHAGDGIKESGSLEWQPLWNELIQSGFAVVATEANPEEVDDHDWDLNPNLDVNDDMQHVLAFLEQVVDSTPLETSTPILLVSFSGAGNFVNIIAPALTDAGYDVRAADIHDGSTWLWDNDFPTVWVTQSNEFADDTDITREDGQGHAATSYEEHIAKGNVGLYLPTPEIPFTPNRMLRHPDYDAAMATQAFDEAVRLGIMDAGGNRLFDILDYEYNEKLYENESVSPGPARVTEQFEVVWAVHRYNGVHAIEECRFLIPYF